MSRYPGVTYIPSVIKHPKRSRTLGICIHNTYGSKAGDIYTLTKSGKVDCHFYITQEGAVYQFLPLWSTSWTAMRTANSNSIHIEHEGKREVPWTKAQYNASAKLSRWLCEMYKIPVIHCDPPGNWRGLYDHRDLMGFEGNNHGDGVPPSFPGWDRYLGAIRGAKKPKITLRQRLAKAGFGQKSIDAILNKGAKAPRNSYARLRKAGFGEKSAAALTGYDPKRDAEIRKRLEKAGFGDKSIDSIMGGAKAPRSSFGRLIRAGFGRNSAKKLTGYDPDKAHD
ncbi:MAG: peptidoglycan recognition protein family protein [Miltoncostaeaceae bacterium]